MLNGYTKLNFGHLYQSQKTGDSPNYLKAYSQSRYDIYPTTERMSKIRFDLAKKLFKFNSILDFGYGNGSFLKTCKENGIETYGYDISDYPLPTGITKTETHQIEVDLITFFDSIEHLEEVKLETFLSKLHTNQIIISVPWLHEISDDWFFHWKHRRENEHFHHFTASGLALLMEKAGFIPIWHGCPEDEIRTAESNLPNILTMAGARIE